jgi:RecJ-like exonuclease
MKCQKCEGKGWNDNEKYWKAKANIHNDNYMRYEPSIKCSKCKGSGYIIGNVKDVLSFLKHLEFKFSKDKEYLEQVKNCINTIENS